ncbi:MAG: hypothetical protein LBK73_11225 [Treponema sp.]|nr:hypothetical protein [Treponema sp.]
MDEEFAGLDFHSVRLESRFIRTMETLMKQPDTSIWYSSENRAEAKAIYRMLGNDGFDREEIIRAHREATIRRMAEYGGPGYHRGKLPYPPENRGNRLYQG